MTYLSGALVSALGLRVWMVLRGRELYKRRVRVWRILLTISVLILSSCTGLMFGLALYWDHLGSVNVMLTMFTCVALAAGAIEHLRHLILCCGCRA